MTDLPFSKTAKTLLVDLNTQCLEVMSDTTNARKAFTCGEIYGMCRAIGMQKQAREIVRRYFNKFSFVLDGGSE